MPADPRTVVRKLKSRPGRGGIRLTYEEGQLLVGMLTAGARAVDREKQRRLAYEPMRAIFEENAL